MLNEQIRHFEEIAKQFQFPNQNLGSTYLSITPSIYSYAKDGSIETTYQKLLKNLKVAYKDAIDGWARSQAAVHTIWVNDYDEKQHGYLFEGEWSIDKNSSIHLRQIHQGWVVTEYKEVPDGVDAGITEPVLYQDQFFLNEADRETRKEYLSHRLYYQLKDGSFQPAFSRFLGFNQTNGDGV